MEPLILALPLIAAFIVGVFSGRISVKLAQAITVVCVVLACLISWNVFFELAKSVGGTEQVARTIIFFNWLSSGALQADMAMKIDMLSSVMLVLVTSVSSLVHIYSIGYMSHDKHPQRFMAYLSLFTFFMLILVVSDNFIQMFLGWEGVGLCSYLLIGFWFKKESANKASMKAFITNRIGDFGLALGIMAVFFVFGSVEFDVIFQQILSEQNTAELDIGKLQIFGLEFNAINFICLMLFIGAMGKSAQLGLHVWLPDAMEGPTPVSALIHAATMVTAGVFLLARCSPIYEFAPLVLSAITIIGALTAIFAATVALTQHDIKRVIAYSTCSQLGYMFFACGVSAYSAGMFHLLTHGFFKALLFLSAGSVIHAFANEQDMRKMGGVWRKIPLTYAMMIIGTLAITGFPFLSGFYSKDIIIESAYAKAYLDGFGFNSATFAFIAGVVIAMLTAFYSWRLVLLAFHGKCRASSEVQSKIHESPKVMTIPLIILSILAVVAGYILYKKYHIVESNGAFWQGAIYISEHGKHILEKAHYTPKHIKYLPLFLGVLAFFVAFVFYIKKTDLPSILAGKLRILYNFFFNKWYFDEIYSFALVKQSFRLGRGFWQFGDVKLIDRFLPNGFAGASNELGKKMVKLQTGYIYHYAFAMVIGLVVIITWYLFKLGFINIT